jgi:hypothetical protein
MFSPPGFPGFCDSSCSSPAGFAAGWAATTPGMSAENGAGSYVLTVGNAADAATVEAAAGLATALCWAIAERTPHSTINKQHTPAIQRPTFLCPIDCFIVVSSCHNLRSLSKTVRTALREADRHANLDDLPRRDIRDRRDVGSSKVIGA